MCKYFISPVYDVHLGRYPNSIMANLVILISQGQLVIKGHALITLHRRQARFCFGLVVLGSLALLCADHFSGLARRC